MIKAIVYTSKTGFSQKYAELLSAQINVPCATIEQCDLEQNDPILFIGWLCAGKIKGASDAVKKYDVKAVAAVGLGDEQANKVSEIKQSNNISVPLFYLRGGLNFNKLKGLTKLLIKMISKSMAKNEPQIDLKKGADFVDEKNLAPIIDWYNQLLKN